jgi:PBP1b-binding outer membrane lipoprotein LpoB
MRLAALLFLTTLMAGCMHYPDTGEAGADQNRLTGQEVLDSGETNLYDAVMRLRSR